MTLQELVYAIEANTSGLSAAFPALQKLEKTLDSLDKAVSGLNKNFTSQMNGISTSSTGMAKAVTANSDKVQEALKRQNASLISAQQKLISLNQNIANSGAPTKLIAANTAAFEELEKTLKSSTTTAADASLARAKYNATLTESARVLKDFKAAQASADSEAASSEKVLFRQAAALESVRAKTQSLLGSLGKSNVSPEIVDAANKAFLEFSKTMQSGELSAEQFQKAMQQVNAALAGVKRNAGFEKDITDGTKKIEDAAKRQAAALTSAQTKMQNLNNNISSAGGPTNLIQANIKAFNELQGVLSKEAVTNAEATLAKAKYNAALNDSQKALQAYTQSEAQAAAMQKATESAIIRQTNATESARIKYENLLHALNETGVSTDKVNALTAAFQEFETTMNSGALNAKKFSDATNKWNKSFNDIKRNAGFSDQIRNGFDALNKVLQTGLGPLSGTASRLSALESLAGEVGIGTAAAAAGFIALGYAMYKSVQSGIAFERQQARINAILNATGNIALETGKDVEGVIDKVANATSASRGDIREAAAGLLTIVGMNDKLLESSLKASQGLALIGGGSIQTSFRNLAQVLQDPAQGFQTLTQYGVKFTASQKDIITNLVEQGNKTEALAQVMKVLGPQIAAATGDSDSLAGAWQHMLNSFDKAGEVLSNNTGLLGLLKDGVVEVGNAVEGTAEAISNLIDWYDKWSNTASDVIDKGDRVAKSTSAFGQAFYDSLPPLVKIALGLTETAAAYKKMGDAQEAAEKGDRIGTNSAKARTAALFEQEVALNAAGDEFVKLRDSHLKLVTEQQHMDNELKNLNTNWVLMKQNLMNAGKSASEAEATLQHLRGEIELQDSSVKNFINSQKQSIQLAQMDTKIAGATGQAKHDLQTEQKVLNDLWQSGLVSSADYNKSLDELRQMGFGPLIDEMMNATKQLDAWNTALENTQALKALQDQVDLARKAAGMAGQSQFAQSQAAAVAAKQQELLNRGIAEGSDQWNKEIALVKQLGEADFAKNLIEQQKEMNDAILAAKVAVDASTMSALEEAKAIAIAAKQQELLNEGVKAGSDYWNQQVAAAAQLVELDFTKQSNQELRNMQAQLDLQDKQLQVSLYSENTRSRMIDLAQKEIELAQKYGSLSDARAQKELEMFKAIQDRQTILDHFNDIGKAIDNAFDSATDAINKWAQTGKLDAAELVRSIAADFAKLELKYLIMDPIHDKLGSLFGGLLGKGSGVLPGVSGTDMLFKVPLPVTVVGGLGGLANPLGSLFGGSGTGNGGALDNVLKSVGITPTPSVTSGVGGGAGVFDAAQKAIQDRIDSAFSGTGIASNNFDIVQQGIQDRIDSAFQGTGIGSGNFDMVQNAIQDRITSAFAGTNVTGSATDLVQQNISDRIESAFQASGGGGGLGGIFSPMDNLATSINKSALGSGNDNAFLSFLGKSEGTSIGAGYNETLGYGAFTGGPVDLTSMNLNQVRDLQRQMLANPLNTFNSSAVGQYQITGRTLQGLMDQNGLTGNELFTPLLQDKFASQLALQRGPSAFGLGQEWSSLQGMPSSTILGNYQAGLPGMQQLAGMPISATQPGGGFLSPFQSFQGQMPLASDTSISSLFGGAGDGTSGLSDQLSSLTDSFSSLTDQVGTVSSTLTDSFSQATTAATSLAQDGLNKTADSLTNLSDSAISSQISATTQTAATTAQMGVSSSVTSAEVQQLGTSAATASASLNSVGPAGGGGGGLLGSIGKLFGFDTGGYTGHGNPDDLAGFVHKGEYVLDAATVDRIGKENLDNMRHDVRSGRTSSRHSDSNGASADQGRGHSGSAGDGMNPDKFSIINLLDSSLLGNYLATREGEKQIMNIIRKNKGSF